jgi:hypothetical protein
VWLGESGPGADGIIVWGVEEGVGPADGAKGIKQGGIGGGFAHVGSGRRSGGRVDFFGHFDTDIVSRKKIIEGEMDEKVGNVSRKVPVQCVQQQQRTSATVRMKNHHAD